jgi:hypothetical protein
MTNLEFKLLNYLFITLLRCYFYLKYYEWIHCTVGAKKYKTHYTLHSTKGITRK